MEPIRGEVRSIRDRGPRRPSAGNLTIDDARPGIRRVAEPPGLAAAGADGVERVVTILRQEFEMAMALTGRASIAAIDGSVLW